uniref:IgGFc-binding protein N-terminal domain-containing protein n=1 Tax=Strongyloides stercoralis TaxID=6248 RepID=A0AAF5CV58_STRER
MKVIIQSTIILFTLIGVVYSAQDTDGTRFITSFLYKNAPDPHNFELSLYFLPTTNTAANVTYTYWSLKLSKIITKSTNADFQKLNKIIFPYEDIISEGHYGDGQPKNTTDPRIFITSSSPIKVIAKLINLNTKQGDTYLVPSISFAAKKYLFKLPEPVVGREQIIHILTLQDQNANVQIISTGPQGHNLVNQTVAISGSIGSDQIILPITTISVGPSIYVSSDKPIIVIGAVVCANLNAFNNGIPSSNNTCDYAAYFPQKIGTWDCISNLTSPVQRVTIGDNVANVIVSPADSICGQTIPVSINSNLNPINGLSQTLTSKLVSRYQMVHSYISEFAILSQNAYISMALVGTPKATNNGTLNGIYISYVPDTTQFYNGETQFISFNSNDKLEVYLENLSINDTLTLDNVKMVQGLANPRIINSFNKIYTVVEFYILNPGFHTFSSTTNYIAYVISKADNNTNAGYGYITGFDTTKIQYTSDINNNTSPTTTPISTTTKSTTSVSVQITLVAIIPDSDGTEFITSFLYKEAKNTSAISLTLYFIPSVQNPSNITIRYYSLLKNQTVISTVTPNYGTLNSKQFLYNDVISEGHLSLGVAVNVTDPRIFISSKTPIKVIAKLYNMENSQGDMYIVPPITFAGTTYLIKLPPAVLGKYQLFHILALENQNVNVQLATVNDLMNHTASQNFTIDGRVGFPQKLISSIFSGKRKSFYIKSSGPILITAAVTGADLNAFMINSTTLNINNYDYAAFMPQPIGLWNGKTMLTTKDRRVTVGEHTVALDVSPSDVIGFNILPIVTYTNINSIKGSPVSIPTQQVTEYKIDNDKVTEFATRSSHAVAVWIRYGSPGATLNQTLHGMYLHYIPESTQFINGVTQFIALNVGDYFEVYVENYNNNAIMTLNGQNIVFNNQIARQLDFFNKTYTVFKLSIPQQGINTFNSSLNYIGYVISKVNSNSNTAYGYLTGFNKSKIQTYWAANGTTPATHSPMGGSTISTTPLPKGSSSTTPLPKKSSSTVGGSSIETTTKSASKIGIYSISITFIYIFVSLIIFI